jgi:hypothetical protein
LRTGSSRYSLTSEQILAVENGLKQVQPHIRVDTCRREWAQAGTASYQSRYMPFENGLKQIQPSYQSRYLWLRIAQEGATLTSEQILAVDKGSSRYSLTSKQILLAVENSSSRYSPHIRADTCH